MQSIIASLYPPLDQREPLPTLYTSVCFFISLLPFLISNKRLAVSISFPLLLALCIYQPHYTFGIPSNDYYNSAPFIALPLCYVDFVLCTPREGEDAPVFLWRQPEVKEEPEPWAWTDLMSVTDRFHWSVRLMFAPHRGIGWNWQAKGVPANPHARLPKWKFVGIHTGWTIFYYVQSVVVLVMLGWSSEVLQIIEEERSLEPVDGLDWEIIIFNAMVGWFGAIWVWDRLCCVYSAAAALSVSLNMFDTWEWPPLMGSLDDAWSVRQVWSVVYHQTFRRMLSQPAQRITRLLGLRKGSLASRYMQLYLTFGISCLFHQCQMFNVARRDMGEFAFFMSQPVAITVEDFVRWAWRKAVGRQGPQVKRFETAVGSVWMLIWFSLTLHLYVRGLLTTGVIQDWILETDPLDVGAFLVPQILEGLKT